MRQVHFVDGVEATVGLVNFYAKRSESRVFVKTFQEYDEEAQQKIRKLPNVSRVAGMAGMHIREPKSCSIGLGGAGQGGHLSTREMNVTLGPNEVRSSFVSVSPRPRTQEFYILGVSHELEVQGEDPKDPSSKALSTVFVVVPGDIR